MLLKGGNAMTEDREIAAMTAITKAFDGLDSEAIGRVLAWGAARFGTAPLVTAQASLPGPQNGSNEVHLDFPSLFSQAQPSTDPDRALVGGYWLQVVNGADDFVSQDVNGELKNVGEGVGNITDALSKLMRRKPAQAMQTQKTGKSKQGRKRYKLTAPGIAKVQSFLSEDGSPE